MTRPGKSLHSPPETSVAVGDARGFSTGGLVAVNGGPVKPLGAWLYERRGRWWVRLFLRWVPILTERHYAQVVAVDRGSNTITVRDWQTVRSRVRLGDA